MLSLPIHKHGMYFHLVISSSVSSIHVLQFSEYKSLALVRFIPSWWLRYKRICLQCRKPRFDLGQEGPLECSMDRGAWETAAHGAAELDRTVSLTLIHRHLTLQDTIVNWAVFLISLSDVLFSVHKIIENLRMLILRPATLFNSFVSSEFF